MDPAMIALFRRRMGVTEPVPPLNAEASAVEPEKKRRRLTKASEKEGVPAPVEKQTALTLRPPKPSSVATAPEKEKEKGKGKEKGKEAQGSVPPPVQGPQVTRGHTGVHPGPVTGASVASVVAGKRPFRDEKEAFEIYSPLVPSIEYEHFARMSGGELMRKICHVDAQSHTIAFAAGKKILALETELKNSCATQFQSEKELKEAQSKITALESEVKESRALKERVADLSQVNEDLGHQISVKNEALKKAIEAAKSAEERAVRAVEAMKAGEEKAAAAIKAEGEKAVRAYINSDAYQMVLDKAVEDFTTSVAGEQFVLAGIEKWQESEDGRFLKVQNFNLGFEDFRKAAKNRYPKLDLSQVCLEDLFAAPAETATAADTGLEDDVEAGEEVSQPSVQETAPSTVESRPALEPPSDLVEAIPADLSTAGVGPSRSGPAALEGDVPSSSGLAAPENDVPSSSGMAPPEVAETNPANL